MKHNETMEQNNNNNCEESPLAGGKPVGYLQVQLREVEPGTSRIKFNEWSERVLNPGSPDRLL